MKKLKKFMPHLSMSMAVAMAVIVYVDDRNPRMGFLSSVTGRIYSFAFCIIALVAGILLVKEYRRPPVRKQKSAPVKKGKTSYKLVNVGGRETLMEVNLLPVEEADPRLVAAVRTVMEGKEQQ